MFGNTSWPTTAQKIPLSLRYDYKPIIILKMMLCGRIS